MFDTTNIRSGGTKQTTTVEFNSVSGTLVKSCTESQFIRFHMESKHANTFFSEEPHYIKKVTRYGGGYIGSYTEDIKIPISVLQVMLAGNDQFLVEYILMKEDRGE